MTSPKPELIMQLSDIGQHIEGQGVFVGIMWPKDRNGAAIKRPHYLFAAPTDLTDAKGNRLLLNYKQAVKAVSKLRNWHGHDGGYAANDIAIFNKIQSGKYEGTWFIPSLEMFAGKDVDGKICPWDNIYALKDQGALAGTFATSLPNMPRYPEEDPTREPCYWSSSESRRTAGTFAVTYLVRKLLCKMDLMALNISREPRLYALDMNEGQVWWNLNSATMKLPCRPCRAVPIAGWTGSHPCLALEKLHYHDPR